MPLLTVDEITDAAPVLKGKVGRSLAASLMHLCALDRINTMYDACAVHSGPAFARSILEYAGVEYTVSGLPLSELPKGPFITVSNHPYGSLDGIILVDLFGGVREDYKVMVNKFLMRIKAMAGNFIPVVPTGNLKTGPAPESVSGVREALRHVRDGHPCGFFPSGAVSDLHPFRGGVEDRPWQEPVLRLIRKMHVPIVPVRFLDRNSDFFYLLGLLSWKLRVTRLPREVFNKKGKACRVVISDVISPEAQDACSTAESFSKLLRDSVYSAV